ncbi:MAG: phenylalanine--tRNA ligase subunit alpha [Candidatus Nealsonbacteria bacterium CG_4_9_14_0_2_um_filter_37_38]|uniref:Phenylalanine--tRNA ligase alpha subunit n=1 Tax=Candidatus Nealsonbacteria bacterium CG_4_10_14_0_8_um_filter_37_14 TaxID=1974684 RepID=A0A2M7R5V7_9BACT|nr:MAG: phenylalanine--tRNA ligase subunit alpha [Candidatus Nealsonbacteria bacterium CG11_big_fil_rev_8_21_14_0_20_37_68]PIW92118.1 MAG: phenylalanine--tRNA ligase subunit alpha [Candidatus Nealsonbacteria bacterium CG_4_8_14_3_um_filter_37_23]PIY88767.1 MAG: phenylalanine--tRNA ligase subunit alpha [Candidatus Nealsonbacteria bacterium CG_4_10_14_0_8_um_filter_37_14]PJC51376.1 MAG: phenylalanine--tRNA ligase subunit alpha [Candidatus Nealsonbacteria bacterium CG_4_9_14_0_2_um_filter_37_38]
MPKINLRVLKNQTQKEIEKAENLKELDEIFKKYLGKRGELTQVLRLLEKLPKTKRVKIGREANELKNFLRTAFDQKAQELKEKAQKKIEEKEWIDITAPGKKPVLGHLHPLTLVKREVEEIFGSMGFSVVEGPEMETEWYNFDALNIPQDHPARDLWDTFYLKNGLILRTHTSPVQVRYMERNNPPFRIIVPGNVFRHEATDPSHEFQLYQVEGLMVDKDVSVANFKAVVGEFFRKFFKKEVKFRLRPDFFPFTEPSFDIGISCVMCDGKGCSVCKEEGFLEVAGAGMVHPNVFKNSKLIPKDWQGWAFGFGLERLAMLKYKINDIRLFRSGDLRFLNQF